MKYKFAKSLISAIAGLGLVWGGVVPAGAATDPLVKVDIFSTGSSQPRFLTVLGDYVYFTANDGTNGVEIWFTDGTALGTQMVGNINTSGNALADRDNPFFELLGGFVYYRANDGVNGLELYRSALGETGFTAITNINTGGNSLSNWLGAFPASNETTHNNLIPIEAHFGPLIMTLGGKLYFRASNGTRSDLYEFDPAVAPNGALAGVTNMTASLSGGDIYFPTVWDGKIYFTFDPTAAGVESLYRLSGSPLVPELVTNAGITSGFNGTIFRLIATERYLLYFESIDNPDAKLQVLDKTVSPLSPVTISMPGSEKFKTDIGVFPKVTVVGNELYFASTSQIAQNPATYKAELRHLDLSTGTLTTVTDRSTGSGNPSADKFFSPVVVVGTDRYVIAYVSSSNYKLYKLNGAVLGAPIADAGQFLSTMAEFDSQLAFAGQFGSDLDLGLLRGSGPPVRAEDSNPTGDFVVREIVSLGNTLVMAGEASSDRELYLLKSSSPAVSTPATYVGPVITTTLGDVAPGDTVTLTGSDLGSVTAAEIDQEPGTITNQTQTSLDLTLPTNLTPGVKDLKLTSSFGVLTIQSFVTIKARSLRESIGMWTQLQPNNTVKFYAKSPVGLGKIQFFKDGKETAWVRAVDGTDPKLRSVNGFEYLVRTATLNQGKNRFEIKLNGKRVWRATYVPVK